MFDPYQQQGPFPPGNSGAPGGPLDGIQNQVASVLNGNGNNPYVYIPGGPGESVFAVPNVRTLLAPVFRFFSRR
jgi:hypothetical protein